MSTQYTYFLEAPQNYDTSDCESDLDGEISDSEEEEKQESEQQMHVDREYREDGDDEEHDWLEDIVDLDETFRKTCRHFLDVIHEYDIGWQFNNSRFEARISGISHEDYEGITITVWITVEGYASSDGLNARMTQEMKDFLDMDVEALAVPEGEDPELPENNLEITWTENPDNEVDEEEGYRTWSFTFALNGTNKPAWRIARLAKERREASV